MTQNLAAGQQVFTSNAFLVSGDRTVLVDVGANFDVVELLEARGVNPDAVVLTHTHPDHVGNLGAITDAYGMDVWGFDTDVPGVDQALEDGDTVELGDDEYVVFHTPGHKNDHVCLYSMSAGVVFTGDLVFQNGGFGRTDLPEGDRARLVRSIEYLLAEIDEDVTELHCGHGPSVFENPYRHVERALQMAQTY